METGPHGRRPEKALIMAELQRRGIKFNSAEAGSALFARLSDGDDDLPALSGMTKDELEAQAGKEGVDLDAIEGTGKNGNVLVGDIVDAIEAERGA